MYFFPCSLVCLGANAAYISKELLGGEDMPNLEASIFKDLFYKICPEIVNRTDLFLKAQGFKCSEVDTTLVATRYVPWIPYPTPCMGELLCRLCISRYMQPVQHG